MNCNIYMLVGVNSDIHIQPYNKKYIKIYIYVQRYIH